MPFLAKIAALLLFYTSVCDERHVNYLSTPYIYVIDINKRPSTGQLTDSVPDFAVSTGPATSAATLTKNLGLPACATQT